MYILNGKGISDGIAIGELAFYKRKKRDAKQRSIEDVSAELQRFADATEAAVGELQVLYEQSVYHIGQKDALIFGVHQMMLEDVEFVDSVTDMIQKEKVNAEYAICEISRQYEEKLHRQGRAEDMRDITARLLRILSGGEKDLPKVDDAVLLFADELLPSEFVQLDFKNVRGIVMQTGAQNSHTAIFARTMGIPMIISAKTMPCDMREGTLAIMDGREGTICIQPDEKMLHIMRVKQEEAQQKQEQMRVYKGKKTKLLVCANIADAADVDAALTHDADGIGLVRTEVLGFKQGRLLTEEEQFQIYRELAKKMDGRRVVIRTWDIGTDKQIDGMAPKEEENPALGCRGIRFCLAHPKIFKMQLRAICRASACGTLAVMFPMITSVQEVKRAKAILDEVRAELQEEKIPFDEQMEMGVMLETPAAILTSREIAKEVDFCSVGTNDLTQYTFALDRGDSRLDDRCREQKEVILAMIQMAVKNVHAEGKRIGICGELASDIGFTNDFVQMGIDELSVIPSAILPIRKRILDTE